MKGNVDIIRWLNQQLQHELTAISQYFLHARMYKNWGFNSLGKHEFEESCEEMKHADALFERILLPKNILTGWRPSLLSCKKLVFITGYRARCSFSIAAGVLLLLQRHIQPASLFLSGQPANFLFADDL